MSEAAAALAPTCAIGDGVVLLHGISRTPRSFRRMRSAIAASGYATLNLGYPSRRKALEALVDDIHPAIEHFAASIEGSIHFVGHSMGGLLARVYLAQRRPQRLGRVVMLGTPNGGSEIADRLRNLSLYRAWYGPAGQQLGTRRDGSLLAMLAEVDYPVGIIAGNRSINPIISLFLPRPNDGTVTVENTRLAGMTDHLVVDASHPWLAQDALAIRQTIAFLREGRFAVPGVPPDSRGA